MNWDDLRVFLAVARSGTLNSAGKQLGVDPTTVARRIGRLEAELGRPLFEVTPSGHVPTQRAQDLLGHVEAMESAALTGLEGATENTLPSATIRVSVSEGFGTWIIAPNLASFIAEHPTIAIELVASSGFLNPSRREADIAIMLARPKRGPLIAKKLTDYWLGLYARRGSDASVELADLSRRPLVGYVTDLIYAPELNYFDEVAPNLTKVLSSTSVNAQAAIINSGAAAGILPCFIGDAFPNLDRLLPQQVAIQRTFWLVVHRDLRQMARIRHFVDWLDRLVGRMQPELLGSLAKQRGR